MGRGGPPPSTWLVQERFKSQSREGYPHCEQQIISTQHVSSSICLTSSSCLYITAGIVLWRIIRSGNYPADDRSALSPVWGGGGLCLWWFQLKRRGRGEPRLQGRAGRYVPHRAGRPPSAVRASRCSPGRRHDGVELFPRSQDPSVPGYSLTVPAVICVAVTSNAGAPVFYTREFIYV